MVPACWICNDLQATSHSHMIWTLSRPMYMCRLESNSNRIIKLHDCSPGELPVPLELPAYNVRATGNTKETHNLHSIQTRICFVHAITIIQRQIIHQQEAPTCTICMVVTLIWPSNALKHKLLMFFMRRRIPKTEQGSKKSQGLYFVSEPRLKISRLSATHPFERWWEEYDFSGRNPSLGNLPNWWNLPNNV